MRTTTKNGLPMAEKERHQVERLKIVNTRDRLKIELQEAEWLPRRAVNEGITKVNGEFTAAVHSVARELPSKLVRRDVHAASKICRSSLDSALEGFCRSRDHDEARMQ
jgi:hypothetical protein